VSIPLPDADYRITVDVIPGQQGDVGLIVLFDGATSFYQLGLRPNGSYTTQRLDEDTITNVTEWANNSELKPGAGVANRIRMERQGSTVSFYANGQFLTDFTVPDESFRNRFGFTITSPTSQGEVGFDNLVGEVLNDS
jgi:hypothetical protein